jgi:hypothetical protein
MSIASRKKLPPFVNSVADLNEVGPDGKTSLRQLWTEVAIKYFDKNIGDPVKYEITDEMIIDYSQQFEQLRRQIRNHVSSMKTWQQLAYKHNVPGVEKGNAPHMEATYFISEWLVTPVRHGPQHGACGCGCGCGCGA